MYRVDRYTINGLDSLSDYESRNRWRLVAMDDCNRFAVRTIEDRQFEAGIAISNDRRLIHNQRCVTQMSLPSAENTATARLPGKNNRAARSAKGSAGRIGSEPMMRTPCASPGSAVCLVMLAIYCGSGSILFTDGMRVVRMSQRFDVRGTYRRHED